MSKYSLIPFAFGILLLVATVQATNTTCISNNSVQMNTTYYVDISGNVTAINLTKEVYCEYGCTNGQCQGSNLGNESTSVWLTYAAGVTFMLIGIVLGAPYQKLSGQEKPELTVTAVRYLFFFAGLFIIYNAFAMGSGMGRIYGMASGIQGAMDTNTIVILITIVLFLFMFAIDFLAMVFNWTSHSAEEKKWGQREV